jgi:predicted RNA-binding protein with PUA-like domain
VNYWLFKSEPDAYSFDDLKNDKGRRTHWDGVRNYQARNFMRSMAKGDLGFFYHSNCDEPGIVGVIEICREAYPDHTAFDPRDKHFDAKSNPDDPRWFMVDVRYKRRLKRPISLKELKEYTDSRLTDFALVRRGNRLSVLPVTKRHWNFIVGLES